MFVEMIISYAYVFLGLVQGAKDRSNPITLYFLIQYLEHCRTKMEITYYLKLSLSTYLFENRNFSHNIFYNLTENPLVQLCYKLVDRNWRHPFINSYLRNRKPHIGCDYSLQATLNQDGEKNRNKLILSNVKLTLDSENIN